MDDKTNKYILWGLIAFFIITAIIIIVFVFVKPGKTKSVKKGHNDTCTGNSDCSNNLVCDITKKVCKSSIGGNCSTLDDCVTGAVSCNKGICTSESNIGLNGNCGVNSECDTGLECQNTVCKSKIGSTCTMLSDCISIADNCSTDGKCTEKLGDLLDPCDGVHPPCISHLACNDNICKVKNFNPCKNNNQCESKSHCQGICLPKFPFGGVCNDNNQCTNTCKSNTVYTHKRSSVSSSDDPHEINPNDLTEKYSVVGDGIRDIFKFKNLNYLLLDSGSILRDKNNNLTTIFSDRKMTRIETFQGRLVALSDDINDRTSLYQLKTKCYSHHVSKTWKWEKIPWFQFDDTQNEQVIHIDTTNDGKFFWVQTKLFPDQLNEFDISYRGYLFDSRSGPFQIENFEANNIRVHGRNCLTFLDIDQEKNKAIRHPAEDDIDDVVQGALNNDGDAIKFGDGNTLPGATTQKLYKQVRIIDDDEFVIGNRSCS